MDRRNQGKKGKSGGSDPPPTGDTGPKKVTTPPPPSSTPSDPPSQTGGSGTSGSDPPSDTGPRKVTTPPGTDTGVRGSEGVTKVKPPVVRVRSSYFTWCQIHHILPCDESLRWYLRPLQDAFVALEEFVEQPEPPPSGTTTNEPSSTTKKPSSTDEPSIDVPSLIDAGQELIDNILGTQAKGSGTAFPPGHAQKITSAIAPLLTHAISISCVRWDGKFRALRLAPLLDQQTRVIGDLLLALSVVAAGGSRGNAKTSLALAPCRSWHHQDTRYKVLPGIICPKDKRPTDSSLFDAVCAADPSGELPDDLGGKLLCADLLLAPWLDNLLVDCRPIEEAWSTYTDPRGFGTLRGWHADANNCSRRKEVAEPTDVPTLETAAVYCRFAAGWNEELALANEFSLLLPTEEVTDGKTVAAAIAGGDKRDRRRVRLEYTANGMFRTVLDLYTGAVYLNDHYEPNSGVTDWVPIGLKPAMGKDDEASQFIKKAATYLKDKGIDAPAPAAEAPEIHFPPPVPEPPEPAGKRRLTELCRAITKLRNDLENLEGLAGSNIDEAIQALGYIINNFSVSEYGSSSNTEIVDSLTPLEQDYERGLACLVKARAAIARETVGAGKVFLGIIDEIQALAAAEDKPSSFQIALISCLIGLLRYEAYQGWMANDLRGRRPPTSGRGKGGGLRDWGKEPGTETGAGDHLFNDLWGGFGMLSAIAGLPVSLRLERRQQLRNGLALRGYKWIDTKKEAQPNPLGSAGSGGDPNSQFWPWAKRATPILVALASEVLSTAPLGSSEARSCRSQLAVHETVVEDGLGRADNAVRQITAEQSKPKRTEPESSDPRKEPRRFKATAIAADAAQATHDCMSGLLTIWKGESSGDTEPPPADPHEFRRAVQDTAKIARKAQQAVELAAKTLSNAEAAKWLTEAGALAADAVELAAAAVAKAAGSIHGAQAELDPKPPEEPEPTTGPKSKGKTPTTKPPPTTKPRKTREKSSIDLGGEVGNALAAATKAAELFATAAKGATELESTAQREHRLAVDGEKRKVKTAHDRIGEVYAPAVASLADTFHCALHILCVSAMDRNVLALRRYGDFDTTNDAKGGNYTIVSLGSKSPVADQVGFNKSSGYHGEILRECETVAQHMVQQCLARDQSLAEYLRTGQLSTGSVVSDGGGHVGGHMGGGGAPGVQYPPPAARPIVGIANIGNSCYLASVLQLCLRLGLEDNYCLANGQAQTLQAFRAVLDGAPVDAPGAVVYVPQHIDGPAPALGAVLVALADHRARLNVSVRREAATRLLLEHLAQQAAGATYGHRGDPTGNPAVVYVTDEPRAVRAELGWLPDELRAQHDACEALERILDAFAHPARLGGNTATPEHLMTLDGGTFALQRASRLHFMLELTKTMDLGVAGGGDATMVVQPVVPPNAVPGHLYGQGVQRQYHDILRLELDHNANRPFAELLARFLDRDEAPDPNNTVRCELPGLHGGLSTFYPNAMCIHETTQFVSAMPQHLLVQLKRFYNYALDVEVEVGTEESQTKTQSTTPTPTKSKAPTSTPSKPPTKTEKHWFNAKVKRRVTGLQTATIGGQNYTLVGFVRHFGDSVEGGHYIAYVHHGTAWFELDDSRVFRHADGDAWPDAVRNQAEQAYLLLYEAAAPGGVGVGGGVGGDDGGGGDDDDAEPPPPSDRGPSDETPKPPTSEPSGSGDPSGGSSGPSKKGGPPPVTDSDTTPLTETPSETPSGDGDENPPDVDPPSQPSTTGGSKRKGRRRGRNKLPNS